MKLPYGNSDFYKIVTNQELYIDRTDRIPLLEKAGYSLLFLRPRRFGKSLLVSMLENYYDVAKADEFAQIFGQFAIGHNPTPLHNQYLILSWDFSFIKTYGSVAEIDLTLQQYLNERFYNFIQRYAHLLTTEIQINPTNAVASFLSLLTAVQRSGHKVYLLIDEYDNFANEVMMATHAESRARYEELVTGEGVFKTVFKSVKGVMRGLGLDRVFITGVSPIVLSDVTSGHNIAKNLTWRRHFNDLCGFTADEVRPLVEKVIAECGLPPTKAEEVMAVLRIFYNGSRFTLDEAAPIYNPTLIFYFLDEFQINCRYPDKMLDGNLAPDYGKLVYVSRHPQGEQLLQAAINDQPEVSVTEIGDRFGMAEMLETHKQRDLLASLLCYLGVLTYAGRTRTGEYQLVIPNLVTRRLYVDRLLEMFFPAGETRDLGKDAAKRLYEYGEMQPLCDFMEKTYFRVLDNRDYLHADELTVKVAFLTLVYNDILYIIDSEAVLERTYADLTMIIRPEMRRFQLLDILIEFKYVALNKVALRGADLKQKMMAELKELTPVKEKLTEAKTQVQVYRQKLERKYGEALRLRSYVVVAIGFDRVVWEEVTEAAA
ncbi:MAG: AAA family ATPase [Caldilineaceae bacterium]